MRPGDSERRAPVQAPGAGRSLLLSAYQLSGVRHQLTARVTASSAQILTEWERSSDYLVMTAQTLSRDHVQLLRSHLILTLTSQTKLETYCLNIQHAQLFIIHCASLPRLSVSVNKHTPGLLRTKASNAHTRHRADFARQTVSGRPCRVRVPCLSPELRWELADLAC